MSTGSQQHVMPQEDVWAQRDVDAADYRDVSEVHGVAFAPEGKTLASIGSCYAQRKGSCGIRLWDTGSGKVLRRLPDGFEGYANGGSEYFDLAFSRDGRTVAINRQGSTVGREGITLYDVQTGRELRQLALPGRVVLAVAFSSTGRIVAGGASMTYKRSMQQRKAPKGQVRFWNTATGAFKGIVNFANGVTALAWSPNGRIVAVGTQGRRWGGIELWDAVSGRELCRPTNPSTCRTRPPRCPNPWRLAPTTCKSLGH
jgi:WD40 repeat protein